LTKCATRWAFSEHLQETHAATLGPFWSILAEPTVQAHKGRFRQLVRVMVVWL
jgi:hypothetical protein